MVANDNNVTSFVVISGINFPLRSRKYLMNLVKEVAEKHNALFVVVAGHVLAGKELEKQLKIRLAGIKDQKEKAKAVGNFIDEMAGALNEFFPKISDANYHIVAAEAIYDRPLGYRILEKFQELRRNKQGDIRLFRDPETKIPVQLPGFGEVRVLVPRKQPWFYENVTGLTQRLINSFAWRTFSPAPPLILVGCTGTGALLPKYKGVYSVAAPGLYKLDEQLSTENMVGCTVITITKDADRYHIAWKVYDFRTVIFNERELALPDNLSKCHARVVDVLKPGSASLSTIEFRVNQGLKKPWTTEKVREVVEELKKRGLLTYNKKENRYAIDESLINKVSISLDEFLKDSNAVTFVKKSCWHVGALKTLYYSVLRDEPRLAEEADAIISNGDTDQGISHNYEYNGELLPGMNGVDKQEIFAAAMECDMMMNIFEKRWDKHSRSKLGIVEMIEKCLIAYVLNEGNHDEHRFSGNTKHALSLSHFERELRSRLARRTFSFLEKHKRSNEISLEKVHEIVDKKIMRVGETRVAKVNGVPIGLQHPRQGKTKAKGMRIQETANFFAQTYKDSPDESLRNICLVGVANFHEAAAVFTACFGRTIFGVMTGAQVYTTQFEGNINKVVEYGMAKVSVTLSPEGKILSAGVEYSLQSPDEIAKEDKRIVLTDKLDSETVMKHTLELFKMFNVPWR